MTRTKNQSRSKNVLSAILLAVLAMTTIPSAYAGIADSYKLTCFYDGGALAYKIVSFQDPGEPRYHVDATGTYEWTNTSVTYNLTGPVATMHLYGTEGNFLQSAGPAQQNTLEFEPGPHYLILCSVKDPTPIPEVPEFSGALMIITMGLAGTLLIATKKHQ